MKIFSVFFFQVYLQVLENAVPDFPHLERIYNFQKNIPVYHGDPQLFLAVMATGLSNKGELNQLRKLNRSVSEMMQLC